MNEVTLAPNGVMEFARIAQGHLSFEVGNCGTKDGRGAPLSLQRFGSDDRLSLRPGEGAIVRIGPGKWNVVNVSSHDDPQPTTVIWQTAPSVQLA